MAICKACGQDNAPQQPRCWFCGAELAAPPPQGDVRKTVTVLFCDLAGSTELGGRLDPEATRLIMGRYFDVVRSVLDRHGATIEKFIGDAVMAVFGIPQLHEDDALRAIRAAVEIREAVAGLNVELDAQFGVRVSIRIGINTGEVVAGTADAETLVTGDAVNVAARLEQTATAGEILIGETTRRLVRNAAVLEPVEALALKGKEQPVEASRLLGVLAGAPGFARRLDSKFVGRGTERAMLERAFTRVADEQACHLFTILGAAGVGKSRLGGWLSLEAAKRARVLIGRCLPYGEGITFWPLVEVVRQGAGITHDLSVADARSRLEALVGDVPEAELVADRLGAMMGLSERQIVTDEVFWAGRRLFEAMAAEQPLVVFFDDVHWAEPAFLDFVEALPDWTREAPILVACLARPELLEERPGWAGGKLNATTILLEPLSDEDCGVLVDNLLGRADLPGDLRNRIVAAGEGNPLFVEETVSMLLDSGLLRRRDDTWVADDALAELEVPATIQAVIAARLDGLEPQDRSLLARAAVVGRSFTPEAVAALSGADSFEVEQHLRGLVRTQLIRPFRSSFTTESSFRFRHHLIRDSAYESLPKGTRGDLHERCAAWLEESVGERLAEWEELIGYHLEQAYRCRADVGRVDSDGLDLAERAAAKLRAAGVRALARADSAAAAGLLHRARDLAAEDAADSELLVELGTALRGSGALDAAAEVLEEAASAAADDRVAARAQTELAYTHLHVTGAAQRDEIRATAARAIETLERAGDDLGLARAWMVLADVNFVSDRFGAMDEPLRRALEHARRAGDETQLALIGSAVARSAVFGPTPSDEGIRRCAEVRGDGESAYDAVNDVFRATLEAMRGSFDEARALYRSAHETLADLRSTALIARTRYYSATVETLAGDSGAAQRELEAGFAFVRDGGDRLAASSFAAFRSELLYGEGDLDGAESWALLAKQLAPDEETVGIDWRAALAPVRARAGDGDEADRLSADAVEMTGSTDNLNLRAGTLVARAEVLRLTGRQDEHAGALGEALALYEAKGNVAAAAKVRALGPAWTSGSERVDRSIQTEHERSSRS